MAKPARPAYVITTCGKKKHPGPAPAAEFYLGSFFKDQLKTAYALQPRGGPLILSNKYGYMAPDFVIPGPYDSHWGYPDTMPDAGLKEQIARLDLRPGDYVVNLGAIEYAIHTRRLFPEWVDVIRPASALDKATMGYQNQLHNRLRRLRKVPPPYMKRVQA